MLGANVGAGNQEGDGYGPNPIVSARRTTTRNILATPLLPFMVG